MFFSLIKGIAYFLGYFPYLSEKVLNIEKFNMNIFSNVVDDRQLNKSVPPKLEVLSKNNAIMTLKIYLCLYLYSPIIYIV